MDVLLSFFASTAHTLIQSVPISSEHKGQAVGVLLTLFYKNLLTHQNVINSNVSIWA